jgi:hypothetical protein
VGEASALIAISQLSDTVTKSAPSLRTLMQASDKQKSCSTRYADDREYNGIIYVTINKKRCLISANIKTEVVTALFARGTRY